MVAGPCVASIQRMLKSSEFKTLSTKFVGSYGVLPYMKGERSLALRERSLLKEEQRTFHDSWMD